MFAVSTKRVLPGFTLSLGTSLLFVCLILLLPLSALVMQLAQMSWAQYWDVVTNPQVVAAYKVTLLSAFVASIFNGVFGLLMAWILTRYRFPGRTLLDALMDLPFALPTAVAGLTLASLFSVNGLYGEWLAKFDIKVTYTWLGIAVAMAFTSIPFVVRTVQPVLVDMNGRVVREWPELHGFPNKILPGGAKRSIIALARMGQRQAHHFPYPPRTRREHNDPVGQSDGLFHIVRHQQRGGSRALVDL